MEPRDVLLKAADLLEADPAGDIHCIATACTAAAFANDELALDAVRLLLPDAILAHDQKVWDWYDGPIKLGMTRTRRARQVAAMMREAAQAVSA